MKLYEYARKLSLERGLNYYESGKVESVNVISNDEYSGIVKGSKDRQYEVTIDLINHIKSTCNCPHAAGNDIMCKHKVALYFSVFPNDAIELRRKTTKTEQQKDLYFKSLQSRIFDFLDDATEDELRKILYSIVKRYKVRKLEIFIRRNIE